jgi:hypothetical protein
MMNTTTAKIAIAIENEDGTWTDVPELTGSIEWPVVAQQPRTREVTIEIDPVRNRELLVHLYGWCIGQTLRIHDSAGNTLYSGELVMVETDTGRFTLEVPW